MPQDWSELSGNHISRRTLLKFSGVGAGLLALGACGQSADTPSVGNQEPASARRGGSLQAAWNLDNFTSLDPQLVIGSDQMSMLVNVCEGLTRLTPALDVEAALAESWDVSSDGLMYTFHLRRGMKWHNGDEFTSQDMIFTYERGMDPDLGSPSAGGLASIADVTAPDDFTVVFQLERPFAPFLTMVTGMPGRILCPVNRRALQQMGDAEYGIRPVGTGPFKITEHVSGDHVTLQRFEEYWEDGYPLLDEVVVDLIPEPSTVQSALLSGGIMFANIVRPQSLPALRSAGDVEASSVPGASWRGLWLNYNSPEAPFLADPRVRLAFAKAIDRDALIDTALFGEGDIGYGVFNLGVQWAYRQNKPQTLAYDLEGARRLLSEADAGGASVALMTNPGFQRTDEVIADMLSEAGIEVSLDLVEKSVYSARGYAGSDYQLMHSGSSADPDPDDSVYNFFHTSGAYNTYGYASEEADRLIELQRTTVERPERLEQLSALEDLLIADTAAGFTYHSRDIAGLNTAMRDWQHIPGLRSFRTAWVAD